jgi:cold-inducible RNA-binding protein
VFEPSSSIPQRLESSSERFQEKSVSKRIYVGNLSFQTTEHDLSALFERIGRVESVNIITDRDTGRSKGFAFVEMSDADADKAIAQLNGTEVGGRTLTVNEARPREDRGGRGDGGRGRSGGRGGYGGSRY